MDARNDMRSPMLPRWGRAAVAVAVVVGALAVTEQARAGEPLDIAASTLPKEAGSIVAAAAAIEPAAAVR